MDEQLRRMLRHDLRGKWNALRLCLTAVEVCDTAAEQAEMLQMLAHSADEIDGVVEQIMTLPESIQA